MSKQLSEDTPFCLGLALLENKAALRRFASLTVSQQQEFIENAHIFTTPDEIRSYVETICEGGVDVE